MVGRGNSSVLECLVSFDSYALLIVNCEHDRARFKCFSFRHQQTKSFSLPPARFQGFTHTYNGVVDRLVRTGFERGTRKVLENDSTDRIMALLFRWQTRARLGALAQSESIGWRLPDKDVNINSTGVSEKSLGMGGMWNMRHPDYTDTP